MVVVVCHKLYGKKKMELFEESWVPPMYTCSHDGVIFQWDGIIYASIQSNVTYSQNIEKGKQLEFDMDFYLLNSIFARCEFKMMRWRWNLTLDIQSVHIYYKSLWDSQETTSHMNIVIGFISLLFHILFHHDSFHVKSCQGSIIGRC